MLPTPMSALLAQHALFAGLPSEMLATVTGCATNVAFPAGSLLLGEGEPADTLYLIRRGRVAIEVHAADRGRLVVDTAGPGEVVGWSWMVPPYRWTFDARGLEAVGAIAIDGACLRAKADAEPAFGYLLLQRISWMLLERLQDTRLRLLDLYGNEQRRR